MAVLSATSGVARKIARIRDTRNEGERTLRASYKGIMSGRWNDWVYVNSSTAVLPG